MYQYQKYFHTSQHSDAAVTRSADQLSNNYISHSHYVLTIFLL